MLHLGLKSSNSDYGSISQLMMPVSKKDDNNLSMSINFTTFRHKFFFSPLQMLCLREIATVNDEKPKDSEIPNVTILENWNWSVLSNDSSVVFRPDS